MYSIATLRLQQFKNRLINILDTILPDTFLSIVLGHFSSNKVIAETIARLSCMLMN